MRSRKRNQVCAQKAKIFKIERTLKIICKFTLRRCCASSIHGDHGERSTSSVGLAQRGFIPGDTEVYHRKISVGGFGETEDFSSQKPEEGSGKWDAGEAWKLQRDNGHEEI